jgi:excisionase family DNA binding protein
MSSEPLEGDTWLTTREAAALIECGERKLLRLIERRELVARKEGNSYRISLRSIRDYRAQDRPRKGKARPNGDGSIYEHPKGSSKWCADLTLPAEGPTIELALIALATDELSVSVLRHLARAHEAGRKTVRKRLPASSQDEARRLLDKLKGLRSQLEKISLEGTEETASTETRPKTVDDLMIEWLEVNVKGSVSESSYLSYGESYRYQVSPTIGSEDYRKLLPKDIKMWHSQLRERTSDFTARNAFLCLQAALDWAVANQYIAVNPARGLKLGTPRPKRLPIKLKPIDIRALRAAAKGYHPIDLIIDAAIFTGDRLGEILGWRWEDIDWDEGTIQISRQLQVLKNKKGRIVNKPKTPSSEGKSPLPTRLLNSLRLLQEAQRQTQNGGITHSADDGFIFLGKAGTRLWPRNVERSFASALVRAGLDQKYPMPRDASRSANDGARNTDSRSRYKRKACAVAFHHLRHSFASLLDHLGIDENTIKALLRHGPKNVTRRYTGADIERMKSAAQQLEDLIMGGKS